MISPNTAELADFSDNLVAGELIGDNIEGDYFLHPHEVATTGLYFAQSSSQSGGQKKEDNRTLAEKVRDANKVSEDRAEQRGIPRPRNPSS